MQINKFLYFGDFVAIPAAIAAFVYLAFMTAGLRAAPDFLISLLIGAVSWTLIEYLIHRFVYHHAPILSPLHDAHHQDPDALIGVPSFVSSGLVIGVCYFPLRMLDPVAAGGFTSGMLVGYAVYMFVHHATHHLDIQPGHWLYRARVRHMAHHYRDTTNFGVSTGVWDRAFGTERASRNRAAHP